jgi:anaerobic selenocysteine-containing dehydrogenase
MSGRGKISRRTWLKGIAAAGVSMMLASTAAEAKASKAAVHYRDYPNGMQMCHMCKFYIGVRSGMMDGGMMGCGMMRGGMMGAGACQVVEGRISPMGWCDLYAPLGA